MREKFGDFLGTSNHGPVPLIALFGELTSCMGIEQEDVSK